MCNRFRRRCLSLLGVFVSPERYMKIGSPVSRSGYKPCVSSRTFSSVFHTFPACRWLGVRVAEVQGNLAVLGDHLWKKLLFSASVSEWILLTRLSTEIATEFHTFSSVKIDLGFWGRFSVTRCPSRWKIWLCWEMTSGKSFVFNSLLGPPADTGRRCGHGLRFLSLVCSLPCDPNSAGSDRW